ncbi:MAG: hypothetical protein AAB881_00245 [Patescibacteria group bacterium]
MKPKELLEYESKNNSWSHAYLFVGTDRGEIDSLIDYFIEKKNILPSDTERYEPEEATGKEGEIKVEDLRNLIHKINLSSTNGRLAVIYGAEKLNRSSGNILLKTLEEPPEDSTVILVSRNQKILPTIKSRCRMIQILQDGKNKELEYNFKQLFEGTFFEFSKFAEEISKVEKTEQFLEELTRYLRQEMLNTGESKYSKLIREVEENKLALQNNANPRLLLENLYIKIKNDM